MAPFGKFHTSAMIEREIIFNDASPSKTKQDRGELTEAMLSIMRNSLAESEVTNLILLRARAFETFTHLPIYLAEWRFGLL